MGHTPAFTVAGDDSTVMGYIIGGNPHGFRDLDLDYTRLVPCSTQDGSSVASAPGDEPVILLE